MIRANSEETKPFSGAVWFPGKKLEGLAVAPRTTRALEIARSREELLGLLKDLPESEYELSLTDLVEKGSTVDDKSQAEKTSPEGELSQASVVKERKKKRSSRRSYGGSSDGVLLNMYMPPSLTRSLTSSTSSRTSSRRETTDGNKRDRDQVTFGCWSAIWDRRWKSRRQELEKAR